MKKEKIIGIITARGGSKSIPGKNLVPVNKKPLIAYTVKAALKSHSLDKVVVSSDDNKILKVAQKYGATAIKRPKNLASDHTSSEAVIAQVLEYLKKIGEKYSVLVLLQPTSPLRDEIDIDRAMRKFMASKAAALISVYEPGHSPYKAFTLDKKGFLRGIVNNRFPFMKRQGLPLAYMPNGAIYIIYVKEFMQKKAFSMRKTIPYVMGLTKSIDIDTLDDVRKVEKILRGKGNIV